jgi:tight adherence protein C
MAMNVLAAAGVFAAILIAAFVVFSQLEERATVRASLRQLNDYQIEDVRDSTLIQPLAARVGVPVMQVLTQLSGRFTPAGYLQSVRKKLLVAGKATQLEVDRFMAVRIVGIMLIPVWFVMAFVVLPLSGKMQWVAFGFLALVSYLGPDAVLNRKMEERQAAIRVRLPDILDLLTISVEAGLGFDQAMDRTIAAVPGPISDEFARMLGETKAGVSRAEALRALDARCDVPEVRSFVLAILQAETFGVSIGRVLRAQSDEMRVKRRQLAQERAQKAPVKMLVPMVFCIFPALFVVVIGPAVINIMNNFVK